MKYRRKSEFEIRSQETNIRSDRPAKLMNINCISCGQLCRSYIKKSDPILAGEAIFVCLDCYNSDPIKLSCSAVYGELSSKC